MSIVRGKLAEKTRELDSLQQQSITTTSGGRASPNRRRPTSYIQRFDTTDLFTAAKVAALEQRTLELEKRNTDLVAELDSAKKGASSTTKQSIDELNRKTAHLAWKDEVAALEAKLKAKDAELAKARSAPATGAPAATSSSAVDWYRMEALLEEHANYRESVGGRLQALRSEKETLQRDLHRKENECQALELKVQNLQRRAAHVM